MSVNIKKPSINPDIMSNFQPISDLPFLLKIMELVIASQIKPHLNNNNLFKKCLSGFCIQHSIETALLSLPVLQNLHLLPVPYCIPSKILLLTHKALHNQAPSYLTDLFHPFSQLLFFCCQPSHHPQDQAQNLGGQSPHPLGLPPKKKKKIHQLH